LTTGDLISVGHRTGTACRCDAPPFGHDSPASWGLGGPGHRLRTLPPPAAHRPTPAQAATQGPTTPWEPGRPPGPKTPPGAAPPWPGDTSPPQVPRGLTVGPQDGPSLPRRGPPRTLCWAHGGDGQGGRDRTRAACASPCPMGPPPAPHLATRPACGHRPPEARSRPSRCPPAPSAPGPCLLPSAPEPTPALACAGHGPCGRTRAGAACCPAGGWARAPRSCAAALRAGRRRHPSGSPALTPRCTPLTRWGVLPHPWCPTLGLSRAWQRERGTSGRWRASAAGRC
jgi:hypothetical protein